MGKSEKGRAGCGCLLFILIVCMVFAGALMHPVSLRLIAGRFLYADKVVPCDAIFVPRFEEDRSGEVYTEAFREYWAGTAKAVWIENDRVFGFTMKDIVVKMANARGIKENTIKALDVEGDDEVKAEKVKEMLARHGVRKVLIVVPAYASRRFHLLYGSEGSRSGKAGFFLVKPVDVPYFKADKWWKSDLSRALMEHEVYELGLYYVNHFRGGKKESGTEK
jgi:uncharacterized SAM-binding protein YcdF (DUF218 family)